MVSHLPFWRRQTGRIAVCLIFLAATLAVGASRAGPKSEAGKDTVKAIVFAKGSLDHMHVFYWRGWTIAFGATAPYGTFPERGTEIHGLRCGQPGARQSGCHLLMVMAPVERRPHYCEILPDSARAEGPWPLLIACPSEIAWAHGAP